MRNAVLAGPRVYLRPLEVEDAAIRAEHAAQEHEGMMDRYRMVVSPYAFEGAGREIYKSQPPSDIVFAVCLKEDDTFLGFIELSDIDWVNRVAETGSWLGLPEYRGKGYGPEAKHLILEYAFDHLQLHAIFATVWAPNVRSAAAVTRQGYKPAGRLKWDDHKDGVYHDLLMFDLLREDWVRPGWTSADFRDDDVSAPAG